MRTSLPLFAALALASAASGAEYVTVTPKPDAKPQPVYETQLYLEPVRPDDETAAKRKAVFPEAFGDDVVAWMDAQYAFGASEVMTVLRHTGHGYRVEVLGLRGKWLFEVRLRRRHMPKVWRCAYDVPGPSARRVMDALLAVLRKTRPYKDPAMVIMGVHYEFLARDGGETLRGRIDNPDSGAEPGMMGRVMAGFEDSCPDPLYTSSQNPDAVLGLLEKHLRREKDK